jgi:hypothetical protein
MRTFLADFDHQQRFGTNPLIIQLGLIHGSLGCYQPGGCAALSGISAPTEPAEMPEAC